MRIRWFALALVALFFGALGGAILAPQPAGAVNRDMVELQQTVSQIQQNQQDMRSAMDANSATMKTLIQQSIDTVNQMSTQMGALQKTVQEVQANTGSRIDAMTTQTQGISDNLQDVQARVGKVAQQLTDMESVLQSIDAKVSGGAGAPPPAGAEPAPTGPGASYSPSQAPSNAAAPPYNTPPSYAAPSDAAPSPYGSPSYGSAGGNSAPPPAMPPISSNTLYQNALRDYETGSYPMARQEFSDYISHFPSTDLASNSQFYLGEIFYAQGDYKDAIPAYDLVLTNYPQSIKLQSALLRKAQAEIALKMKTSGIRDLREVVSRFPGTDEARHAKSMLQTLGAPVTPPRTSTSH